MRRCGGSYRGSNDRLAEKLLQGDGSKGAVQAASPGERLECKPARRGTERLSRAPVGDGKDFDGSVGFDIHRDGVFEAVEHFVGGVLEARVGLVELAGRLGGELTQLVAIIHVREGSKNKI